jgi:type II secretory pathway pseudopilin PulG
VAQISPSENLGVHGSGAARNRGTARAPEQGLTLIELIAVVAIVMIIAAITVEAVQRASRSMRLHEAAISYSNLLQQARIRAVRDDKFRTVLTTPANGPTPPTAFVDLASNGLYAAGDPMMIFPMGVTPMPFTSGPNLAGLEAQFLPPGPGSLQTVNTTAQGPTFGTRGLPCTPTAAGPNGTCPYLSAAGIPTAYIAFLQNTQSGNWMAVTVTPAGRIRQWAYSAGTWSALN